MQAKRAVASSKGARAEPAPAAGQTRRSLFARLREEVEILHQYGLSQQAIADVLEISPDDVRSLRPSRRRKGLTQVLSRRALTALLRGRHAAAGGGTLAERAQRLPEIACAYTLEELAMEPGVGAVTVTEVALWLGERGLSFRPSPLP